MNAPTLNECVCDEIDASDRPCLQCEAEAYKLERHPRYTAADAAEKTMVLS